MLTKPSRRDIILFVGDPWRATANLVRGSVFTMLYRVRDTKISA